MEVVNSLDKHVVYERVLLAVASRDDNVKATYTHVNFECNVCMQLINVTIQRNNVEISISLTVALMILKNRTLKLEYRWHAF